MEDNRIRVLLVEDSREDAWLIQRMLRDETSILFDVAHVAYLDHALKSLDSDIFDVILLDLHLPDSHGFETFEDVHALAPEVPVVVLTGHADDTLGMRTVKAGAQDYFNKGLVDGSLLARAIRYAIERNRVEQALREEQSLFIGGPVVALKCRRMEGWPIEYVSPNVVNQFGYAPDDFTSGKIRYASIIHPDDLQQAMHEAKARIRSGAPYFEREYRIADAGGSYRWIYDFTRLVRNRGGAITHYHGYVLDITERKRVEEELCRSEEKFSKAFHHAPLLMTLSKVEDGAYLDVNEKFVQVSGFSREEILGKTSVELGWISLEDRNRLVEVLKARGRVDGMELTLLTRDKRPVHCLYNGELIDVDNQPSLLSIAQDITEHKQIEEKIRYIAFKRTQEALERLTLHNKLILDAAGEGIIGLDQEGRVTFVNPAAAKMLGWGIEELLGKSLHSMIHHTKADGAPNGWEECRVCTAYRDGRARKANDEIFWKKEGTFFPVEYVSTPIFEQGELTGTVLVFQDISERQQWERQLRQAHKMQALGTLAGGIAHDFNNILATMILNTEMAMDDVPKGSSSRRNLERVLKAGNRARDLVEQILAFSRQSEQKKQPFDITPIVKETLKLIKATIPSTIEVSFQTEGYGDGSPALVLADPTQIHQVLMNLCANAAHAMGKEGGKLGVDLLPVDLDAGTAALYPETAPGSYWMIRVRDTGHGIEQDILDRIFDPFFTTKRPGEGTGLGLSMAYGIVESHGGSIRVESEPGRGTTFEVLLPRIDAVPEEQGRLEDVSPSYLPGGTERILLVDDEEELLDTCRKMLDRLGYKVVTRKNGREALETFQAQPDRFDLIITDQTMPEMTGIELAERITQIRSNVPVILCTGYGGASDLKKAKASGIRELFQKPFDRKQMAETIRKVLGE